MVGKKILPTDGVTHDVFKVPEPKATEEENPVLETVGSEQILQTVSEEKEAERLLP